MNAPLQRKGRVALGGVSLVATLWVAAPWVLCSETWARETPPAECVQQQAASTADARAKPFSLRDHAPPLAPRLL